MPLPLPDLQNEASMIVAAEAMDMDKELHSIDDKLNVIAKNLIKLVKIEESTAASLQGMLEIDEKKYGEELQNRGTELEALRESGRDKEDKQVFSFKEKVGEATSGLGILASAAIAVGGTIVAFREEIDNFLKKFGVSVNELDNIAYGLAAARAQLPKPSGAPKPTATPNAAAKAPTKTGPVKPTTTAKSMLQGPGKENLAKQLGKGKIPAPLKEVIPDKAPVPGAGIKAAEEVGEKFATKAGRKILAKVPFIAPAVATFQLGSIYASDMDQAQKEKEYSGVAGALAGAWLGAKAGFAAGSVVPGWGNFIGAVGGGLLGGIYGEEAAEGFYDWVKKAGWFEKDEPAVEPKSNFMTPNISAEDAAMNQGPITAPSETQMYGMNPQGFVAAQRSREAISAENMAKIQSVKPSIAGDNMNVTVKVEQGSKETVDPKTVTPIIRQGDTINNTTVVNGTKVSPGVMPNATNPTKSWVNYSENWDPVVDGP